jgi:hypothetical protein
MITVDIDMALYMAQCIFEFTVQHRPCVGR